MSIVETTTGLKVHKLDDYFKDRTPGPLAPPAFMTCIVAPKGSGKTTFLINLLHLYQKKFHHIYLFSATVRLDPKWEKTLAKLNEEKERKVFEQFDPSVIQKIMYRRDVEKKKEHTLIIYDDMISDNKCFAKWSKNEITKSIYNQRQYMVSTIIVSQKYTEIPSNMRGQMDTLIISRLSNNEIDLVYNSLNGLNDIPEEEFKILYKYATRERFDFMLIDLVGRKLYKNFDLIEWQDKSLSKKKQLEREISREMRKRLKKEAKDLLMARKSGTIL